jgi:serine/threonine protein kinase
MWSCGVLLYVMVTGTLPWTQRNQVQLFRQIRRGAYTVPKTVSAECADLIKALMSVSVEKRIDAPAVLAHPWMADVAGRAVTFYEKPTVSLRRLDQFMEWDIPEDPLKLPRRVESSRRKAFDKEARGIAAGKQAVQALKVPVTRTAFFRQGGGFHADGAEKGAKKAPPIVKPVFNKASLLA